MATSITVDVSREAMQAPAEVQRRIEALRGARLNRQIARGVGNVFSNHFYRLDAERANRLGGDRTHFWSDAGKSVSSSGDESGATITVAKQGVRQRLEGGVIRPGPGRKYLTIPARAEAYGRRAREFSGLRFIKTGSDRGMLVAEEGARAGNRRIGKQSAGTVMFWCVPSVVQKGDPNVLPRENAITAAVMRVVDQAWKFTEGNKGNGGGQ